MYLADRNCCRGAGRVCVTPLNGSCRTEIGEPWTFSQPQVRFNQRLAIISTLNALVESVTSFAESNAKDDFNGRQGKRGQGEEGSRQEADNDAERKA